MKKIINGVIAIVLIGVLGWNTYSIYQLKEQVTKEDAVVETEKNYEEYIPVEKDNYTEEDTNGPYMLFLTEEAKNKESLMMQKDSGKDNALKYIMNGSATLCYSSRDKLKD